MSEISILTPNLEQSKPEHTVDETMENITDEGHESPRALGANALTPPIPESEPATSPGHTHQAAFVNKLYSIVEDPAIKDVMWTESGLTFLVTCPIEFSKCLHNYFKHNNWQSFVRQLNMYQFHKVNDVFHSNGGASSASDVVAWEFKHPCFQRGRIELLHNIKRKASRPAAPQRDIYTNTSQVREDTSFQQPLQPRIAQQTMREPRSAELQRSDLLIESLNHRIHGLEESQRLLMDQTSNVFGLMRTYQGVLLGISNVLASAIPDHNTAAIQRDCNALSQQFTQYQFNPRRQHLQPNHPMQITLPSGPMTPMLSTSSLMSPSGWSNPGSPMLSQMNQRTPDMRSPNFSPHTSAPNESSDSYFRIPLRRPPRQSYHETSTMQPFKSPPLQHGPLQPHAPLNILTPPLSDTATSPKDFLKPPQTQGNVHSHNDGVAMKRPSPPQLTSPEPSNHKEERCRTLQSLLNNPETDRHESDHDDRKRHGSQ